MYVGIGTEATLFPEKEYIMEISFAVQTQERRRGVSINITEIACSVPDRDRIPYQTQVRGR